MMKPSFLNLFTVKKRKLSGLVAVELSLIVTVTLTSSGF